MSVRTVHTVLARSEVTDQRYSYAACSRLRARLSTALCRSVKHTRTRLESRQCGRARAPRLLSAGVLCVLKEGGLYESIACARAMRLQTSMSFAPLNAKCRTRCGRARGSWSWSTHCHCDCDISARGVFVGDRCSLRTAMIASERLDVDPT